MDGDAHLDELNNEALAAITDFAGRVRQLEVQLEDERRGLDAERRRLGDGALDPEAFRERERALTEQLLRCLALGAKLGNLATLLAVSRGQFAPDGETAPELDAWRVVARSAAIAAQEVERSRLAREIHDGPAQVLANAILGLELCEQIARRSPERLSDELGRLQGLTREGLVEVRRFIFDLRPSTLADHGLLATLRRYVADYQAFFGLQVELIAPDALPPLTREQEIAAFRIVQESLQNVQKHARAAAVTVRLELDQDALAVTIRDDGRGFTPRQEEPTLLSGAGLGGMRERAAAIGGELRIASQPGTGTTVRLTLPRAATGAPPAPPAPPAVHAGELAGQTAGNGGDGA